MAPTNLAVLLPVQNGTLDQCRKAIKFVRVQLNREYWQLTNVNPPGPTVLQATYYIKLLQTLRGLVNGNGGNYNLLMFDGPNNLRMLTPDKVKGHLLDITLQGYPLDLLPPSFNIRVARMDFTALQMDIDQKILCLAMPTIYNTLFGELCPGYSNQPHVALDHIFQVHTDTAGNQVLSTVQAYFQQLMSVARPFSSQREFPVSVC